MDYLDMELNAHHAEMERREIEEQAEQKEQYDSLLEDVQSELLWSIEYKEFDLNVRIKPTWIAVMPRVERVAFEDSLTKKINSITKEEIETVFAEMFEYEYSIDANDVAKKIIEDFQNQYTNGNNLNVKFIIR